MLDWPGAATQQQFRFKRKIISQREHESNKNPASYSKTQHVIPFRLRGGVDFVQMGLETDEGILELAVGQ